VVTITDKRGSGPFVLTINATIVPPRPDEDKERDMKEKRERQQRVEAGPSQPDVGEKDLGPDAPPVKIEKDPKTDRLKIVVNRTSKLLEEAKALRTKAEEAAVSFVFKYGLALAVMGLLDSVKGTEDWQRDDADCRQRIEIMATGIARVIVPLCLSLPRNLPKTGAKAKAKAKTKAKAAAATTAASPAALRRGG
jgi:hypothetical protein